MGVQATVEMNLKFGQVMDSIFAGTVQGLNQAAEHVLGESAKQVPFDNGILSSSGSAVHTNDIDAPAAVVYDSPQAARLHEHPEYQFQGGRKGKYLEDAAVESQGKIREIVAEQVAKAAISNV